MTMLEVLASLLIISVFVLVVSKIYELLVMPLHIGKNSKLDAVLRVNGSEPELEATVKSLLYLRNSGKIRMNVIIVDNGMDKETKKTAEILARNSTGLRLFKIKDLCSESYDGEGLHRDKRVGGYGNISE